MGETLVLRKGARAGFSISHILLNQQTTLTKSTSSIEAMNTETGPQLRYTQDGRGGTIYYISSETSFDLWYEFALSPAIVIIGIPESRYWEATTKTSLSQRTIILQFIGEQVVKDKLLGEGYFRYNDNIMTIYRGRKPDKSDR